MLLAVQTGLRVSKLIGLVCADLTLGTGANVLCEGKGRKQRAVPLVAAGDAIVSPSVTRTLLSHFGNTEASERHRLAAQQLAALTDRSGSSQPR